MVCGKPELPALASSDSEFLGGAEEVLRNKGVVLDRHEGRHFGGREGKMHFPEHILSAGVKSTDGRHAKEIEHVAE